MGDQQRGPAKNALLPANAHFLGHDKEQHERDAGDDFGIDHRDIADVVDDQLHLAAHGVDADGGKGPQHGGNHRGNQRQNQRQPQGGENHLVVEQADIPFEGEAGKHRATLVFVEAVGNQHRDGKIHKAKNQDQIGALKEMPVLSFPRFHHMTPSISSSSKLEVKLMHSRTITISTRLMAEPRFRL